MPVLLSILLTLLSAPALAPDTLDVPPVTPPNYVVSTGSPHTLNLSGASGTVTTRMPGNDAILLGLDIDESGDAPCDIDLVWWRNTRDNDLQQGGFNTNFSLCGEPNQSTGLVAVGHDGGANIEFRDSANSGSGDYYVFRAAHGLRVCLNGAGTRVKGVRLFGSTINQDDDREARREPALKRDFERPNCNTWKAARRCPAGEVVVGLDIHHDGSSIKGLAPKCASVTVTIDGSSAGTRRSN